MTGWTDLTSIGERFSQFILMAAMILGNQAIARRAQNHRVREEGRRIRYLLRGSMRALRDLYDDKLEWEQFLERRKMDIPQWSYHVLGWGSGIFFFLGLILGFLGAAR